MKASVTPDFWKGKKVFLTGHTGFKGSWLTLWLQMLGAEVKGFALTPPTTPALFDEARIEQGMLSELGDIRDLQTITRSMISFNPDLLVHMAAQSLVRLSYRQPVETYSTNVMGSLHVLEAARQCPNLRVIVNVTTDKCYENREWEWGYREDEPMGGHDPYSNSKGCVELLTAAYRKSFFNNPDKAALSSVRAGNVIGGGDWAEDRLIPDILRAFEQKQPVVIRNPRAIRPWQHVLEPLGGYLVLAEHLWNHGQAFAQGWNFGPRDEDVRPVEWIMDHMVKTWGAGTSWKLDLEPQPHEALYLKLDISKAQARLHWSPTWNLGTALDRIVNWHRSWLRGENVQVCCLNEIKTYMADMPECDK
ncbi:CDP-glucose 4,6-dehydratase [Desulfoprunum benzoelyticum]|uniref:CDP-glucose 4,6-dehydratase n=1 Tax=Desulfoprunum benzoelyticum TaxID=1506996 RepID=A0A840UPI4_9BACT|nr:CDP-glucose 4,6-dehydratase [Desulfoprunum benzoelyticum]MBB5347682.1 CDP-glucose 4,6-dehydratase [Desulfoprunum benzoelyticum]MBM9529277.1 CDP-glucose 4,6-dehydratase [Desulfoprunum benzoelyticum]